MALSDIKTLSKELEKSCFGKSARGVADND